jgi:hypothetical protein
MENEQVAGRGFFREQVVADMKPIKNVPIIEFAESSDYCDKPLYPKQQVLAKLMFLEEMEGWEEDVLSGWIRGDGGTMISPMVRERRDYLRGRGYKHFGEIILDGGRRSSKGYMTGLAVAKKIHDVQQIPDPGRHYGIDPDKQILFSVVANKLEQARDLQWADIASWSSRCKPLQQHIPQFLTESFGIHTAADRMYQKELEDRGTKINADWSKLLCKPLPARQSTLRGSASMVIVFDEFAHMLGTEGAASGKNCFEAALPSLRQFGRDGLIFCNSSPYTEIGQFFEEYEKAIQLDGAHPSFSEMLFINFPSWELYTDWRLHPHRLSVDQQRLGSLMVAPECPDEVPDGKGGLVSLTEEEQAKREKAQNDERGNPETFAVEARAQWAKVVDSYLKGPVVDMAFAPVFSIGDPPVFEKAITMSHRNNYNNFYVAHCDPSSTTAGFGFAIGHVEMLPDPFNPTKNCEHVIFDLVKRWNPADFAGHTINYLQVQEELADYCQAFFLKRLTFDQFQSQSPIQWLNQELRQRRLDTRVFEVTATQKVNWNRYETFKTAMNMQRVHIPFDCPDSLYAMDELKFLQIKNGKVEKQDTGPIRTKDIADCIAEVTAHLLGDAIAAMQGGLEQPIRSGAQGGYQIGGRQQGGPMGAGGGMSSGSFDEFYNSTAKKRGENVIPARGVVRRKRY